MNTVNTRQNVSVLSSCRWWSMWLLLSCSLAEAQLLSTHYPEPSTNGALHYNRALLAMSIVPVEEREVLARPVWEAFGESSRSEIEQEVSKLTHAGRHALRAALKGTSCDHAHFGLDYSDYGHGATLPHVQPMLELGRLLTLAGIYAQIQQDWDRAGSLFFEGLWMGRHMTGQPSLAETIVGVQILENNYFALAYWATRCPETKLVRRAFLRFEAASEGMVRPAFTLAKEASIVQRQHDRVRKSYPDGAWAEMLLESLGELTIGADKQALQQKAKQICVERGVPQQAFASKANFSAFVSRLSNLRTTYFRSLAASMTLPTTQRALAAKRIHQRAQAELDKLSKSKLPAAEDMVVIFASHEAERAMTRVALAAAAGRTDGKFPEDVSEVASRFSGVVPKSPYNGAPIAYKALNGGKDMSVTIPGATAGETSFPQIEFSSHLP